MKCTQYIYQQETVASVCLPVCSTGIRIYILIGGVSSLLCQCDSMHKAERKWTVQKDAFCLKS